MTFLTASQENPHKGDRELRGLRHKGQRHRGKNIPGREIGASNCPSVLGWGLLGMLSLDGRRKKLSGRELSSEPVSARGGALAEGEPGCGHSRVAC